MSDRRPFPRSDAAFIKGVVIGTAGALLLLAAAVVAVRTVAFLHGSARADGVVVRLNAGGSHPEVAFTTARGERISYPQGGFISGWKPGDHVVVRYAPARPRDAEMDRFGAIWSPVIFMLLLGGAFVAGAADLLFSEPDPPAPPR